MASKIHYNQATFLTSAAYFSQLPADVGAEVAFIGRSNAGKSSALNAITHITGLARTSQSPGRTQLINLFTLDDQHRLVDLPGYGFAKVPPDIQARWEETIADYFEKRQSLVGLILVMDARHSFKESDREMMDWCIESEIPLHILLTKADKLTPNEQRKTLFMAQKTVSLLSTVSVQLFSALKKSGIDEARQRLDRWFDDQ